MHRVNFASDESCTASQQLIAPASLVSSVRNGSDECARDFIVPALAAVVARFGQRGVSSASGFLDDLCLQWTFGDLLGDPSARTVSKTVPPLDRMTVIKRANIAYRCHDHSVREKWAIGELRWVGRGATTRPSRRLAPATT